MVKKGNIWEGVQVITYQRDVLQANPAQVNNYVCQSKGNEHQNCQRQHQLVSKEYHLCRGNLQLDSLFEICYFVIGKFPIPKSFENLHFILI